MWACPRCGREFKNASQARYCSARPRTIDEYIALLDEGRRADLQLVRRALAQALP